MPISNMYIYTPYVFWRATRFDAGDGLAVFARSTLDQLETDARDHAAVMAHGHWLPFPSDDGGLRRQKR